MLPNINAQDPSRKMIRAFGSYNHNRVIDDAETYDETNLSSRDYPTLCTRQKRYTYNFGAFRPTGNYTGFICKNGNLYFTVGNYLFSPFEALRYDLGLTNGEKKLVGMGAYIIIFPDKKWYNTIDHTYGSMESSFTAVDDMSFTPATLEAVEHGITVSAVAPTNPSNLDYWYDQSTKKLKVYTSAWNDVTPTCTLVECEDIGKSFDNGDTVKVEDSFLFTGMSGYYNILMKEDDRIVIDYIAPDYRGGWGGTTFSREVPDMDFICESENRLWGCKYGNGINEIYASAQGNFKDFHKRYTSPGGAYAVSVGSDGAFTGCVSYGGYPTFFKERMIHRIYGSMPSNYQINNTVADGVKQGSHKTLAVVNNVLYYLSRAGVMAYSGGIPQCISDNLGNDVWKAGAACGYREEYYLSVSNTPWTGAATYYNFVWDTQKRIWRKEDDTNFKFFDTDSSNLYGVTNTDCVILRGRDQRALSPTEEDPIEWDIVSGCLGYEIADRKYYNRIEFRIDLDGQCELMVSYDGGEWKSINTVMNEEGVQSFSFSFIPQRCDHFQYRLKGVGDMHLYSVTKSFRKGSDIR